jgi:short-subunit dehydrogenase
MIQLASYGPWALVTGASSGIGKAFAQHLAAAGVNLVLAARSTDRLTALGTALAAEHGVEYRVATVDLSTPDGAPALIDATRDLDIGLLVSNAGSGQPGAFLDQRLDDLHNRLRLNTITHMELTHAFGRRFVARGGGGIILVAALGAMHGLPNMAHESASKAYVLNLGEALHHELASAGVDVTVMLPGNVDTPIIDAFGLDRGKLPISPLPAHTAVRETARALAKHRPLHIPDRRLRLMTRLIPRNQSIRLNGRMLGQAAGRLASPT